MKWTTIIIAGLFFISCKKETRVLLTEYPDDINFEDNNIGRFSFEIPGVPFSAGDNKSGIITINSKKEGTGFSGFAISNKNSQSYPFSLSPDFAPAIPLTAEQRQQAIDSTIFSVYTGKPNRTGNFLVGNAKADDAFITLATPSVIEHILVANNTYNFLQETYGSIYSGTLNAATQTYSITGTKVRNILNPNTSSSMYGRFYLPGPDGSDLIRLQGVQILGKIKAGKAAADQARLDGKIAAEVTADSLAAYSAHVEGFVKLTITGYEGNKITGKVDHWLAILAKVDEVNPTWNIIRNDWNKVDLSTLGAVDKIIFNISSSYNDSNGNSLIPPYFCLDGMRIRK